MIGQLVSHYRIIAKLGEGGMGVVYKAEDTKLRRIVALKFLAPHLAGNEDVRHRFLHEAQAVAALSHPNICVVHEVDEEHNFIAMEFVEGETVSAKVKRRPLPLDEALNVLVQTAHGLQAAHEKEMVHRDIKSANLMVTPQGQVKVMDFGLAQVAGQSRITRTGSSLGTPAYMAPELFRGETVDRRTDIWSLGVVLYEMITGKLPFSGETDAALLYSVLNTDAEPPTALRTGVPVEWDRIVKKTLSKDREQRYQHVEDLLVDLKALHKEKATFPASPKQPRSWKARAAVLALGFVLVAGGGWLWFRSSRMAWAREVAIPEIERLAAKGEYLAALRLADKAGKALPGDRQLVKLLGEISTTCSIETKPAGALVEIKEYSAPEDQWLRLGTAPLKNIRVPSGYFRWRISKPGFAATNAAIATWTRRDFSFELAPEASVPVGMVRVPRGEYSFNITELGGLGPYRMEHYFIDQYEVTNREFKEFIDKGGYQRRELWKHPIVKDGRSLTWEEAMAAFHDSTGRPGPAAWEGGRYPPGQDDYPVNGVSWYEADAYAVSVQKSLPTITHWFRAANPDTSRFVVPLSNFSGSVAPVGKYQGVGTYGTYDMAGNVREWCWNESEPGQRFILGGAWNQPAHLYSNNSDVRPAFDRSPENGFRCARYLGDLDPALLAAKQRQSRDYRLEKPVSGEMYQAFLRLYAYDRTELNVKGEMVEETADWRKEKITFNAAYGNDRVIIYLFTPKDTRPPYQTVVFFPGAGAAQLSSSRTLLGENVYGFLIKSGRALAYPVFWGTYERRNERALQRTPAARRERTMNWSRDLSRTIDYLETRSDLDKTKTAYAGVSQGSWVAPVLLTVEPRIRTAILLDGGLPQSPYPTEVDPINFITRFNKPVLMLNGRYDYTFPYERSQLPFFRLLGTPERDKRHVVYETAHNVPVMRNEMIRESLGWLDKYLGKVQ